MQINSHGKPEALPFHSLVAAQSGILDKTISLILKNQKPTKKVCMLVRITASFIPFPSV